MLSGVKHNNVDLNVYCRYLGAASVGTLDRHDNSLSTEPEPRPVPPLCSTLTGLVADQLSICHHSPAALQSVRLGAQLGLLECQFQFQHERWNCSPAARYINQTVFDNIVKRGQLLTTATVVYQTLI